MASEGREWLAVLTADGSATLRHPGHGEALHSAAGAWTEAWERYVRGCRVPERLAAAPGRELAVLDVGTGLGLNLAALLRAAAEGRGRVRVTTLEVAPEVIRRAAGMREGGEDEVGPAIPVPATAPGSVSVPAELARRWLRPVHGALLAALDGGSRASSGGAGPAGLPLFGPTTTPRPPRGGTDSGRGGCIGSAEKSEASSSPWVPLAGLGALRLLVGDARETIRALEPGPRFDAVFLDPFSPAVEPELWTPAFLRQIAARMAPGSWLATYSAATAVRAALAAAGLRVGSGGRVGSKADGTLASPDAAPPPLPPRVERRIARRAAELEGLEHDLASRGPDPDGPPGR